MMTENLQKLYQQYTGVPAEAIEEMPASGSNRRYFRLTGVQTLIGVYGTSKEENEAFLYMAEHFKKKNLSVPQVVAVSEDKAYYLQEDLGNTLLFNANYDHSLLLSQLIVEKLATNPFHKWGRGIHQNDFLLLKKMTCPAVLVETAFLSNANERQLLVSAKWQEVIAQRLFEAFKEYKTIYDASVNSADPEPVAEAVQAPEIREGSQDIPKDYYGIQIMGLGRLLREGDPALKGLKVNAVKAEDSKIYRYVYGTYADKSAAASQLQAVRRKFPEAFVVRVNGNTVTRVK